MRAEVGSHAFSAPPFSSGGGLLCTLPLLHHGVPPMGHSLPGTSPVWVLPKSSSSSRDDPVLIPLTGCSLSRPLCSSVGPPQAHKSCQQNCPAQASHSFTSSFGHPPALAQGPARLQVSLCTPAVLMRCRVKACPTWSAARTAGAHPATTSLLPSVSAETFLSHILTPLWLLCHNCFFSLFKAVIPEALPSPLMFLALASGRPILDLAGIGSVSYWGRFWQIFIDTTPSSHPITETLPCQSNTHPNCPQLTLFFPPVLVRFNLYLSSESFLVLFLAFFLDCL